MKAITPTLNNKGKNKLKLDAVGLAIGDNTYGIACPHCGESKSFSVSRISDGILYHCFRNSCGVQGFVFSKGVGDRAIHEVASTSPPPFRTDTSGFVPFPYKDDMEDIPEDVAEQLFDKYELLEVDCLMNGWKYSPRTHRLLMPIHSFFGGTCGWVAKKLEGSKYSGQKSITYRERDDGVKLAFGKSPDIPEAVNDTVIIVEDQISAAKLGLLVPTAALLGTNFSIKQAAFLATHYKKLIIALDPDAATKALHFMSKYSGAFESCMILSLAKDPKDTPMEVLESRLIAVI